MKIHMGCGSVYLMGYYNVDLPLPYIHLTQDRPALVEQYQTTEGDYYGRHGTQTIETWKQGPKRLETVCDAYGSFTAIPARPSSATEILSRQVFEHLPPQEGVKALKECNRVLQPHGLLRIDVPDPEATLKLFHATGDNFYIRHFFGPRIDEFGFHTPYTRDILTGMCDEAGFRFVGEEPNIHPYPAFMLQFEKRWFA